MIISLVAAMANHRVIGLNNQMPWHMPADLAWFKRNTVHKPVIMGRNTYQSIGRPLPQRHNIIISRNPPPNNLPQTEHSPISWVNSVEAALQIAGEVEEVCIIGGGNIYQQTLPLANRLYLTHIQADLAGDTFFPDYHPERWQIIFQQDHPADEKNPYPYQFQILQAQP